MRALIATHPDNYYLCANLAVAAELQGRDAEALDWLERAFRIRPDAHSGTEWMHGAFLKAKLAIAADPSWLLTHTVSGIPISGDIPGEFSLKSGGMILDLEKIHKSILAHSIPRLLFVKDADPLIGAMLTELARVEARLVSVEAGLDMLKFAVERGASGTEALQKQWMDIGLSDGKRWDPNDSPGKTKAIIGVASAAILGFIAYYLLGLRRARQRGRALNSAE